MGDGLAELQQAAEGERGHVGFAPAVRLLLHVLLKLDPTGRLPPLHLLVLIYDKLVQLHKHLRGTQAEFKGIVYPNNIGFFNPLNHSMDKIREQSMLYFFIYFFIWPVATFSNG